MRVENSFIGVEGVGEKTERDLWEQGVVHWDDFYPDAVGPTTAERVESFIDEGYDRLDADDVAYFDRAFPSTENWRLWESFAERACCFDIETTGLDHQRNEVTTVSYYQDGEVETLVRGDDLTADALAAMVEDADLLVSFNGKRFDVPFLEASFDVDLDLPHIDLMYTCRQVGLSGGLKPIERELGIERDRPDISGREAVQLWHRHERGDDGALETLIEYNREDAVNLATLADRVASDLDAERFEAVRGDASTSDPRQQREANDSGQQSGAGESGQQSGAGESGQQSGAGDSREQRESSGAAQSTLGDAT